MILHFVMVSNLHVTARKHVGIFWVSYDLCSLSTWVLICTERCITILALAPAKLIHNSHCALEVKQLCVKNFTTPLFFANCGTLLIECSSCVVLYISVSQRAPSRRTSSRAKNMMTPVMRCPLYNIMQILHWGFICMMKISHFESTILVSCDPRLREKLLELLSRFWYRLHSPLILPGGCLLGYWYAASVMLYYWTVLVETDHQIRLPIEQRAPVALGIITLFLSAVALFVPGF